MTLDVPILYRGFERAFGPDAITFSERNRSTGFTLIAIDGAPTMVDWLNNGQRRGLPLGMDRDTYALTTLPPNAQHIDHIQTIKQINSRIAATYSEEDWADYLEGLDDYPRILQCRRIGQPILGELLKVHVRDTHILNAIDARHFREMKRELRVPELRELGRELRAHSIGQITLSFLSSLAINE